MSKAVFIYDTDEETQLAKHLREHKRLVDENSKLSADVFQREQQLANKSLEAYHFFLQRCGLGEQSLVTLFWEGHMNTDHYKGQLAEIHKMKAGYDKNLVEATKIYQGKIVPLMKTLGEKAIPVFYQEVNFPLIWLNVNSIDATACFF